MSFTETIHEQLRHAVIEAVAAGYVVRTCNVVEAATVIASTKEKFVAGQPKQWWWQSFSRPPRIVRQEEGLRYLTEYVGPSSSCWMIIDDDSPQFPVLQTTVEAAAYILNEMSFVEFYLVGHEFDWLICENHHGMAWLL